MSELSTGSVGEETARNAPILLAPPSTLTLGIYQDGALDLSPLTHRTLRRSCYLKPAIAVYEAPASRDPPCGVVSRHRQAVTFAPPFKPRWKKKNKKNKQRVDTHRLHPASAMDFPNENTKRFSRDFMDPIRENKREG